MDEAARSLPTLALAPACLALAGVVLLAVRWLGSRAAVFLVAAVWLRYIMSAWHEVTYRPAFGGVSWNALGSILVVGAGLLVVRPRHLLLKALVPVYLLAAVVALSGAMTGGVGTAIDTLVKYAYLAVVLVAAFQALVDVGSTHLTRALATAFAPLFVFQAMSLAMGVAKAGEADGSVSYIGGFNHEAAFSVALATAFIVISIGRGIAGPVRLVILACALGAIVLANYRTTILALLPLVALGAVDAVARRFRPDQRGLVLLSALTMVLTAGAGIALLSAERFQDLAALAQVDRFVKPPADYSIEEQRVLSGRAYIWSTYLTAYAAAPPLTQLIGFGPDAWVDVFPVYPHNSLVDYAYEYGLLGVAALLLLWLVMARQAFAVRAPERTALLLAHLSFFLLNMATMAHWLIEGQLLYALLCGYTLHARYGALEEGGRVKSRRFAPRQPFHGRETYRRDHGLEAQR